MTDDNYGCLPGPNNFRRIAETMEQKMTAEPTNPSSTANHQRDAPEQFVNQTWQKPRFPGLGCPDRDWCAGNGCWWDCTRPFDIDSEEP